MRFNDFILSGKSLVCYYDSNKRNFYATLNALFQDLKGKVVYVNNPISEEFFIEKIADDLFLKFLKPNSNSALILMLESYLNLYKQKKNYLPLMSLLRGRVKAFVFEQNLFIPENVFERQILLFLEFCNSLKVTGIFATMIEENSNFFTDFLEG